MPLAINWERFGSVRVKNSRSTLLSTHHTPFTTLTTETPELLQQTYSTLLSTIPDAFHSVYHHSRHNSPVWQVIPPTDHTTHVHTSFINHLHISNSHSVHVWKFWIHHLKHASMSVLCLCNSFLYLSVCCSYLNAILLFIHTNNICVNIYISNFLFLCCCNTIHSPHRIKYLPIYRKVVMVWGIPLDHQRFFYAKLWPYHWSITAEIKTHQTRKYFPNCLLSTFGTTVQVVALVSCSLLTGAACYIVFWCCSPFSSRCVLGLAFRDGLECTSVETIGCATVAFLSSPSSWASSGSNMAFLPTDRGKNAHRMF